MKKIKVVLLILLLNIIVVWAKTNTIELTIFFTNDTNGHPLSFSYMQEDDQAGIPARATLIKKLLKDKNKPNVLILDAGGILIGRPESNLFDGITDITGMNSIGYDAAGVGISELWGSLKKFNALNSKADFYFLCANVKNKKNNEICDKFIIKKFGGFKGINVGIFSVITDEAINELPDEARKEYKFLDPIKTAEYIVQELKSKKNKADIIIALTYMGYYPDDSIVGSRTLASSVNGIDIIIDARTGLKLDEPITVNKTKICQAFKWGLYLGEIKLKIKDKKIIDFQYQLHPVNYKKDGILVGELIKKDEKVLKAINSKMFNIDNVLKKTIAKIKKEKLDPKNIRYKETEIGNLICDAMIDFTKADMAFQNAGGIGKEVLESEKINRRSFDEIIKYDNSVVLINMMGAEVKKILKYSMNSMGYGGFLQVGGIRFTYSKSSQQISDIKVKDKDLDDTKIYKVAINSWLAAGGDGYEIFKKISNKVNLNILHREVVYNYLEKQKNIKPCIDGRINIID